MRGDLALEERPVRFDSDYQHATTWLRAHVLTGYIPGVEVWSE